MRRHLLAIVLGLTPIFGAHAGRLIKPRPNERTQIVGTDGRTHSIMEPRSNIAGAVRGVTEEFLVPTDKISRATLFGRSGRPSMLSFGQGLEGFCYGLSAARMYANPRSPHYADLSKVIESVFFNERGELRRSKVGIPQARFFQKHAATGRYREVLVDITGKVPMRDGKPVYAAPARKGGPAWGPLFEAAYTKFRDEQGGAVSSPNPEKDRRGWNRTGNGGSSAHVMEALTGRPARHFTVTLDNAHEAMAEMQKAIVEGLVVTSGTNDRGEINHRIQESIRRGTLDRRSLALKFEGDPDAKDDDAALVGGHEYGVTRVDSHGVVTNNPWNKTPIMGHGKHGHGQVDKAHFPVLYGDVDIGAGSAIR